MITVPPMPGTVVIFVTVPLNTDRTVSSELVWISTPSFVSVIPLRVGWAWVPYFLLIKPLATGQGIRPLFPANELDSAAPSGVSGILRSEEHTSELQSRPHLVCRLLLEKKSIRSARP